MSFSSRPIREKESRFQAKKIMAFAVRSSKPFLWLKKIIEQKAAKKTQSERRVGLLKRTATVLLSTFLIIVLLVGTLRVLLAMQVLSLSGMMSFAGSQLPADKNGYTNLLLLGVGDNDHDGIDLTDTMMVASIDARTKSVALLSIPRDLYVLNTAQMGKGRINSLYRNYKVHLMQQDGMKEAQASQASLRELGKEVGGFINLPIHEVVKVNFSAFIKGIDTIGGIDVNVPYDLLDTQYPGPDNTYTYETFSISKGPHHLDGATALKYARSRHSTSDFSRSARQQQILMAVADQAKSTGLSHDIGKITELYNIISKNIETTMGIREILSLAALDRSIDRSHVVSMQLNDVSGYDSGLAEAGGLLYTPPRDQFAGASVLLPASLSSSASSATTDWKQIQVFSELLFRHRELFINPATVAILNAGAPTGSARQLGGELKRFGFQVMKTVNYPKKLPAPAASFITLAPVPASSSNGASPETLFHFLGQTLKLPEGPLDPATSAAAFAADAQTPNIIIVIGKDFTFKPLLDLVPITKEQV